MGLSMTQFLGQLNPPMTLFPGQSGFLRPSFRVIWIIYEPVSGSVRLSLTDCPGQSDPKWMWRPKIIDLFIFLVAA